MSDRLDELKRQRALAQQQLEWFDREIARESGGPPAATPAPASPLPAANAAGISPAAAKAADDILARYQEPVGKGAADARKGCILYFVLALGMLVIFTVGAYFIYVQLHPRSEGHPPASVAP